MLVKNVKKIFKGNIFGLRQNSQIGTKYSKLKGWLLEGMKMRVLYDADVTSICNFYHLLYIKEGFFIIYFLFW